VRVDRQAWTRPARGAGPAGPMGRDRTAILYFLTAARPAGTPQLLGQRISDQDQGEPATSRKPG